MKILLDENIPIQLKKHLGETHEWVTVKELKIGGNQKWPITSYADLS